MNKYLSLLLLCAVTGLTSCLKDDVALDPAESNNVIEIYQEVPTPTASPANAVHPLYVASFNVVPEANYQVHVNYSGPESAPEDIVVTLALDPAALSDYNTDQGTAMEVMPIDFYDIDTWTVTIPKGQKKATINLKFFTDQFDLSKSYALPFKIVSVSSGTISGNYGIVLFNIVAKNKYDGRYKVTGTFNHVPGSYEGDYPKEIWLTTVNANTVDYFDKDWENVYYIMVGTGANSTVAGGYYLLHRPRLVFDVTTDKLVEIRNASTNAVYATTIDPNNNQFTFNPNGFTITYQLSGGVYTITEEYEYLGPRP